MSVVNNDRISQLPYNLIIMFKKLLFRTKRTNKNRSKIWISTRKLCDASITTHESSIVKPF